MRQLSGLTVISVVIGLSSVAGAAGPTLRLQHRINGTFFDGRLGACVRGGVDVNGDGFSDICASEYTSSPLGRTRAGAVRVYSGYDGTEILMLPGQAFGEFFSSQSDLIEDIDGDGLGDVVVGAPETAIRGMAKTGVLYVYSGGDGHLIKKFEGVHAQDQFGFSVARVGNGRGDFLIGVPFDQDARLDRVGSVALVDGPSGFIFRRYFGEVEDGRFGQAINAAGDVDGDGVIDHIVGAPGTNNERGRVYVFSGATGRELLRVNGEGESDLFGFSVAGAGDVDGDGRGEIVVGAPFTADENGSRNGASYLLSGADGHIIYKYLGRQLHSTMGLSVCGAGDVNEDGVPDFIVGSPHDECVPVYHVKGQMFLKSGADGSTIFSDIGGPDPAGDIHGIGFSCSPAGDVDGDGLMDFVTGAVDSVVGPNPFAGSLLVYVSERSRLDVTGAARPGGELTLALQGYAGEVYKIGASIHGGPKSFPWAFPDGPGNVTALDIDLMRLDVTRRTESFIGTLDGAGRAEVLFNIPNRPIVSGRSLWFQFGLMNPVADRPPRVRHLSNSVEVRIE